jgi:Zn-finger nucleic acid-binding protein
MICPVCAKDALIVEFKGIELDYCPVCHGVWFDAGELELLLEAAELETSTGFLTGIQKSREADTAEKKRQCPICRRKMNKVYIDEGKKIITDVCHYGHGMWFDGGEVASLVKTLVDSSPQKAEARQVLGYITEMFQHQTR